MLIIPAFHGVTRLPTIEASVLFVADLAGWLCMCVGGRMWVRVRAN
jgi:hypothetical protein